MSFVESNRYCEGEERIFFNLKITNCRVKNGIAAYNEMPWATQATHLKADRAVVMHCSFHTAVRILQDVAVATPCQITTRGQQRIG
jgi:hypothetical protein